MAFSINSGLASCYPGNDGCKNSAKYTYYDCVSYKNGVSSCEKYNNCLCKTSSKFETMAKYFKVFVANKSKIQNYFDQLLIGYRGYQEKASTMITMIGKLLNSQK